MTDAELKEIRERAEKEIPLGWQSYHEHPVDVEDFERVRTDVNRLLDCIQGLKADLAQTHEGFKWLQNENARLREALKFYAELEDWGYDHYSDSKCDYGERAREALEGK